MWKISKNRFFGFQKFIIMVPKMVPQWYPKCLMVPKMVPKWYPNSLTHFFKWWFFIIFQVKKMATWPLWPHDHFGHNFGYHREILGTIDIFSEHIPCQLSEKKGGRYLAIFTYLAWFFWFFTKSIIFTCGTNCIF